MKTIAPTPYPDVNRILTLLLSSVKENLGNHFTGMYLFGSLANGGFDKDSDIDVLVVTNDEISEKLFSALHAMHVRIAEIDSPWAIQLEVSYIPQNALRRFDPTNKLHPHIDRGSGESLHSKPVAAQWGRNTLGKQWAPLIKRACLGRQNPGLEAQPDDIDGTLKFIRHTLEYSRQIEDSKNGTQNS